MVRAVVDEVVAEERECGNEVPRVRSALRTGAPADVLSRVSREAQLLVVGDRGRGQLASRLIGFGGARRGPQRPVSGAGRAPDRLISAPRA